MEFSRTLLILAYPAEMHFPLGNDKAIVRSRRKTKRGRCGSLGPLSTEDQAAGIKETGRTQSFVDSSRVGIWGWSGSGSNTLNAMFRKPDVYHVGIAVAPKPQPDFYNAWFQEIC